MREHEINKQNLFIGGYYLDDDQYIDNLVTYFHVQNQIGNTNEGYVAVKSLKGDYNPTIDKSVKDSIDFEMDERNPIVVEYLQRIQPCLNQFIEQYPGAGMVNRFIGGLEKTNIQWYAPGGGFHVWHTESNGANQSAFRHLVFMTYLNDVNNGGETEFMHQKVKIKPEKGLTLIWAAHWTHFHRGIPAPEEEKIIITGWYDYVQPQKGGGFR